MLVNAAGQIEAQSGGFSVTAGYPTLAATGTDPLGLRANGNVYINANEPLGNNGIYAVVALQNTVDLNGDGVTNGRRMRPTPTPSSPARSPSASAGCRSRPARLRERATSTTSWSARG